MLIPLIQKEEPVPFPQEALNAVTAFTAEKEKGIFFKRIQLKVSLYDL